MPKFCANLSMLFTEVDFTDRFASAARAGFSGVEYLFPYDLPAEDLAALLKENRLIQVLHNLPAGDWEAGERGVACIPGREAEFREGVDRAIHYARILECDLLNCLVGKAPVGIEHTVVRTTLIENLRFAVQQLAENGIRLLIEPLNTFDIPGFALVHTRDALDLMREVGHPNLFLQYDVYHMQMMEGNLTATVLRNIDRIAHIQIADVPGRHEPGTGEINFRNLFRSIDAAGYTGWIGCEYKPAATAEAGLGWLEEYSTR
ncbi:MAG TPA: hydroxypyruvate isomerase [Dissulfurispiraceae bacterium]|nr:hydroxypyruvate isomerase [Dissulfurispiraceae bacterium]